MTARTITTADLATLVTRRGADFETGQWTVELTFPASEPVSVDSWRGDLLAALPSAPVLAPVVSDAAVEAGAVALDALWRARTGFPEGTWESAMPGWRDSRLEESCAVLTAAAPLLAAQPVPEASREDVAEVLRAHGQAQVSNHITLGVIVCVCGEKVRTTPALMWPEFAAHQTDALLARFVITERTDR